MCSHGYFYQGTEMQTRATLKGLFILLNNVTFH